MKDPQRWREARLIAQLEAKAAEQEQDEDEYGRLADEAAALTAGDEFDERLVELSDRRQTLQRESRALRQQLDDCPPPPLLIAPLRLTHRARSACGGRRRPAARRSRSKTSSRGDPDDPEPEHAGLRRVREPLDDYLVALVESSAMAAGLPLAVFAGRLARHCGPAQRRELDRLLALSAPEAVAT
jgi:hypothetical protein